MSRVEPPPPRAEALLEQAWSLLLACARIARRASGVPALAMAPSGPREVAPRAVGASVVRDADGAWQITGRVPAPARDLLALYLPVCRTGAARALTVGHLGQSLDGFVATAAGDSRFVNHRQNIVHLHRMRALCDAVLVGGATVRDDDPQLTTRHVVGPHPVRVVIDPELALGHHHRIFNDRSAPTLVAHTREAAGSRADAAHPAQLLAVAADRDGRPQLSQLLAALNARGHRTVFVEGGGVTVSRFLAAGLLDRLQLAVAPVLIGEGRPGIRMPPAACMERSLRPAHRVFRMGEDVLFDCDLRAARRAEGTARDPLRLLD